MEHNIKMAIELPKEMIKDGNITEDTAFETYYEDGFLNVRVLTDEEIEKLSEPEFDCDGNCDDCELDDDCPYDDDENDSEAEECADGCEHCEYFCHRCGTCILDADESDKTKIVSKEITLFDLLNRLKPGEKEAVYKYLSKELDDSEEF